MITWLAIKAAVSGAWKTFTAFCKERWELIVGALVGILGMLALTRGTDILDREDLKEEIKARDDFQKALTDAKEAEISEILRANEEHLIRVAKVESDFKDKIDALSEEKKDLIREHQESGRAPEELAEILGLKLK